MPNVPNKPTFNPTTVGGDEYSVEINDSNYSADAWKNSRYEGVKTQTITLNKISPNDITSGKTAAAQKYSRNIYLGNFVVGMTDEGTEDNSLTHFPNFTYIGLNSYLTINDDDTFDKISLEDTEDNFDSRKAYYRTFTEDFDIGTSCKLVLNDFSVRNNLRDRYNIFWNEGQLVKVAHIIPSGINGDQFGTHRSNITHVSSSNELIFNRNAKKFTKFNYPFQIFAFKSDVMRDIWGSFDPSSLLNNDISEIGLNFGFFNNIFPPTPAANPTIPSSIGGVGGGSSPGAPNELTFFTIGEGSMISNPNYRGLDKYFATMIKSGSIDNIAMTGSTTDGDPTSQGTPTSTYPINIPQPAIIVEESSSFSGNTPNQAVPILKDFTLMSTAEIIPSSAIADNGSTTFGVIDRSRFPGSEMSSVAGISITLKNPLAQDYISSDLFLSKKPSVFADAGSVMFSRNDNSKPSVLIKMNKNIDLPNGVGDKGFVVIPENLHPYIKDNLIYFLAKAGIPLGVDTIPARNDSRKKLK